MMTRRSTAYRIARLLFLVLIVALAPISAWAQETTLTANVPSVHTLHIELTGSGKIAVDGVPYERAADIQIKRHSTPDILINPDNGWKIKSVFLEGQNISDRIQNGTFLFPEICDDMELIVVFEAQSNNPQTGDASYIVQISLLLLLSLIGLILCVMAHRKIRANDK